MAFLSLAVFHFKIPMLIVCLAAGKATFNKLQYSNDTEAKFTFFAFIRFLGSIAEKIWSLDELRYFYREKSYTVRCIRLLNRGRSRKFEECRPCYNISFS